MGVAGDGEEEIFEYSARMVAELTDIDGIPINIVPTRAMAPPGHEQLVEGHIVFHTMDIIPPGPDDIKEINVEGFIECRWEVFGVTIPSGSVDRVYAECNTGGRIFTTDPTVTGPRTRDDLHLTGWEKLVKRTDNGDAVLTTEYWYWGETIDEHGEPSGEYRKAYAWESYVIPKGENPHTGKPFNFVMGVNLDRLHREDVPRVRLVTADQFIQFPGA